jgi:aminoglycoside phosphotransferase (APT) family kinase protein
MPVPSEMDAAIRDALETACPGLHVDALRPLNAGYTSKQWVADTDEGPLLVKVPQRNRDPEHLRRLVVSTRVAAEHGIPVVRFRALVTQCPALGGPVLIQEFQEGAPAEDGWETLEDRARLALCEDLGTVVGRLHSTEGPRFGDVLGVEKVASLEESVESEVEVLLGQAEADLVGDGSSLRAAISKAVSRLDHSASTPALTHSDLWLPNILLRNGRISCVLDFEHAMYADRFRDFGKLDEHVFDAFAPGRTAFLESYSATCPLPDDWEQRVDLAHLLHSLTMYVYFLRWTPKWAPQYAREFQERLSKIS